MSWTILTFLPLSLVTFLPAIGALLVAFFPRDNKSAIRWFTLAITAAVFLITAWMALPRPQGADTAQFSLIEPAVKQMQNVFSVPWIKSFNIDYFMGIDGISFPLVLLTTFVSMLAMGASWTIDKHVKAYCILFLLLETGMLGVFLALDFFLFYVFWEVMLLPMYFLIGVWGGPRREYAAIKFFLYTLLGSVFMLIAILMLYFTSDLRLLSDEQLVGHRRDRSAAAGRATSRGDRPDQASRPKRSTRSTFWPCQQMGQHTEFAVQRDADRVLGQDPAVVGVPAAVHRLRDQGAGVPVPHLVARCPRRSADADHHDPGRRAAEDGRLRHHSHLLSDLSRCRLRPGVVRLRRRRGQHGLWRLCGHGAEGLQAAGRLQLGQPHGLRRPGHRGVERHGRNWKYNPDYWAMGMNGAMFQMIAHGISSAGMFFMVGVIYDRVHHRNLDTSAACSSKMPVYSGLAIGIFFAGLGLPGLCGFIGEVLVMLSVWNFSQALAVISASAVILTAGYILWTIQRVYLGAEYKGPHGDHLYPITAARTGDRRAAVGVGDRLRRVSAGDLQLHDADVNQARSTSWPTWTEGCEEAAPRTETAVGSEPSGLQPLG